jgi:hypothetical protein
MLYLNCLELQQTWTASFKDAWATKTRFFVICTAIPGMNFPEVPNAIPIDKMYRMISQFAAKVA